MKNIMVIDDSESIRTLVKMTLDQVGYQVSTAVDGQDALDQLNGDRKNLIICDINMPRMNGFEFLETIKQNDEFSDHKFTPIIMLTTEGSEEKKSRGQMAGARAWLTKPFIPEQLLVAVEKLCN